MRELGDSAMIQVSASMFERAFNQARHESDMIRTMTSSFEHVPGTSYFHDGIAGYAIRPDGELVLLHSTVGGQGDRLVESALEHGASRLDCFDGYLPRLYARHGFVETSRSPNWTVSGPDVIFMSRVSERAA